MDTISKEDVLEVLDAFIRNGTYSYDELLCFASVLLGISEDAIMEALPEKKSDLDIPDCLVSKERLRVILESYVSNDAEASELGYVQEALEQAGCDQEEAEKIGLGWVWPDSQDQ